MTKYSMLSLELNFPDLIDSLSCAIDHELNNNEQALKCQPSALTGGMIGVLQ